MKGVNDVPFLLRVIRKALSEPDSITMSSQRRAKQHPAIFRQKQIKYPDRPKTSTILILFIQALWTLSAPKVPSQTALGLWLSIPFAWQMTERQIGLLEQGDSLKASF